MTTEQLKTFYAILETKNSWGKNEVKTLLLLWLLVTLVLAFPTLSVGVFILCSVGLFIYMLGSIIWGFINS